MKKVFFLSLIFSCFTMFGAFASESIEKSDGLQNVYCEDDALVSIFANCIPVHLTCWESPRETCFDESYTAAEITELVGLMEGAWCTPPFEP